VTLSINDTQHNNALPLCWVSQFINCYAECRYAECCYSECRYAECHDAKVICRGQHWVQQKISVKIPSFVLHWKHPLVSLNFWRVLNDRFCCIFTVLKIVFLTDCKPLHPRKSYWRGRLSTVDLLVLTSLDKLLFILKPLFANLQNKLP
jgi:hypothetical protein